MATYILFTILCFTAGSFSLPIGSDLSGGPGEHPSGLHSSVIPRQGILEKALHLKGSRHFPNHKTSESFPTQRSHGHQHHPHNNDIYYDSYQNPAHPIYSNQYHGGAPLDFIDHHVCGPNQLKNARGVCVAPEVVRNLYVFDEPKQNKIYDDFAYDIKPKVKLNLIVIRSDEKEHAPLILPSPQQKTMVLVLKKDAAGNVEPIEIPDNNPPLSPEVFFIKYDNPNEESILPGGISLQDALTHAIHPSAPLKEAVSEREFPIPVPVEVPIAQDAPKH